MVQKTDEGTLFEAKTAIKKINKMKPSLLQEFQIEVMSAVALPNPI